MHNLLNEFADLSQRLDHLVAYSSQMVFISGEQMGNQKKFVEAFLGSREQNQDIVYLTGNSFHNEDDVRQEFARQLAGNSTQADISLLQLLANRNKDRALLIAITRAERLPDQILQELWDLVLQNRFARNHQHINILLFGEQEWAEKTKSWLPTNNNDKPVLLTSETVEVQGEQELEGDLDAYIKTKRKEFNERLKQRALAHEAPKPIWAKWWMKLLAVCVFILAFSGMMLWQYFDLTQNAVKDFASFLFQAESSSPVEQWQQTKDLLAETQNIAVNEPENIAGEETAPEATSATTPETINGTSDQAISDQPESSPTFVTSWKEESEKLARQNIPINLPKQTPATESQTSNAEAVAQPKDINTSGGLDMASSESANTVSREQLLQLQGLTQSDLEALTPVNNEEIATTEPALQPKTESPKTTRPTSPETKQDSNVITEPLIPNELAGALAKNPSTEAALVGPPIPERIKQQREQTAAEKLSKTAMPQTGQANQSGEEEIATAQLTANSDAAVIDTVNETGAVDDYPIEDIVTVEELVAQQNTENEQPTVTEPPKPAYIFNETALLALPEKHYLLQVSGMSSRTVLDEYLRDNRLTNTVWIYKTTRYGGDWFVVLYNKSFSSLNDARNAVNELPQTSRQSAPFAKSVAMIREEIAQGYPN